MLTSVGRTSTKLFSPLGYLESPSTANDAVGWIFLFSTGRSGSNALSDLLNTIGVTASLGTPRAAEAPIGLEQSEARHTAGGRGCWPRQPQHAIRRIGSGARARGCGRHHVASAPPPAAVTWPRPAAHWPGAPGG